MLFYIAQFFGLLSLLSYVASTQTNRRRTLVTLNTFVNIFAGIQYLILGSPAGLGVELVGILRNIVIGHHNHRSIHPYGILIFCLMELLVLVSCYDGISSILVVVSGILTTIYMSQKDLTSFRFHQILYMPISIIYNILVGAWVGVIMNLIQDTSLIIGMRRFDQKKIERAKQKNRRKLEKSLKKLRAEAKNRRKSSSKKRKNNL